MRYTFFLYSNEAAFADATPEQIEAGMAEFGAYIGALQEAGAFVGTDWLQPTAVATTISMMGGTSVKDGPAYATEETIGGWFQIDVKDLDEAIKWAQRCPAAHYGRIEIRPSAMPA